MADFAACALGSRALIIKIVSGVHSAESLPCPRANAAGLQAGSSALRAFGMTKESAS